MRQSQSGQGKICQVYPSGADVSGTDGQRDPHPGTNTVHEQLAHQGAQIFPGAPIRSGKEHIVAASHDENSGLSTLNRADHLWRQHCLKSAKHPACSITVDATVQHRDTGPPGRQYG